jgi:uncharacterized protein DUF1488
MGRPKNMPLVRASNVFNAEKFVGVRFIMADAAEKAKRVICLVTYEALQNRAAFDGYGDDWMGAWREHRKMIEGLASLNYDRGRYSFKGEVVVDRDQLMPIG